MTFERDGWWTAHIPWVATIIVFLLVLMKVLAVSHFSAATALAVLQLSGFSNVVLGSLALTFPALLIPLMWGLAYRIELGEHSMSGKAVLSAAFAFVGAVIVLFGLWWASIPIVLFWTDFVLHGPLVRRVTRSKEPRDDAYASPDVQKFEDELDSILDSIKESDTDVMERIQKLDAEVKAANQRLADAKQREANLVRKFKVVLVVAFISTASCHSP